MTREEAPLLNSGPLEVPPDGFPFTSESPLRRFTEPAAFFVVPAIATRAVFHDQIAAAVSAKSKFQKHPYGRWIGTSNKGLTITLDELPAALNAMKDIFEFHKGINDEYRGVQFDANDVHAQTWVLDCVFYGIETASRRWARPLQADQLAAVWHDVFSFGRAFGIPSNVIPNNLTDLREYRAEMFDSKLLQTPVSFDLLQTIFTFHTWKAPKPVARFGQAIIKGSIESELLEQAHIHVTATDRRINTAVDSMMQHSYAKLPKETREKVIPFAFNSKHKLQHGIGYIAAKKDVLLQKAAT